MCFNSLPFVTNSNVVALNQSLDELPTKALQPKKFILRCTFLIFMRWRIFLGAPSRRLKKKHMPDETDENEKENIMINDIITETNMTTERTVCGFCPRTYWRFRLVKFLLVLLIYIFLGGLLFRYFEREHEITLNTLKVEKLKTAANNLTLMILSVIENESYSKETKSSEIYRIISQYQEQEGLFPKENLMWSLLDGIFFSGTVVLTIGYGNLYPLTANGRIAVMIYAFVGIPLMLFFAAEVGKSLTKLLNIF